MIRLGLRMRYDGPVGTTTGAGGGTTAATTAVRERPGTDGLCDGCGGAWPCARCADRALTH